MANVYYDKETKQYFMYDYPDYHTSPGSIKDPCTIKDPWSTKDSKDEPIPEYTLQNYTRPVTTNEDLRKQLELVTSQYLKIKERMDQMEQRERELIKKLMEMVSGPDDKAST